MPTIADIAQRSRAEVAAHFLDADATSPGAALTYQPQRHAERRALAYLMGKGVVRLTQEGRHWIDAEAFASWQREIITQTALIAGGAFAAIAGFVLWRRYWKRQS